MIAVYILDVTAYCMTLQIRYKIGLLSLQEIYFFAQTERA